MLHVKNTTKKLSISNQMLGSTIFASKYLQFKNPMSGLYSMIPQSYETCRLEGTGEWFMKRKWF